jgi:predicted PurR-regulated permease PerM
VTGRSGSSTNSAALWILAVLATVLFLRTAKALVIPIALALLISYALEPVVAWLERHRVPRMAGAALVLLLILGAGAGGANTLRDDALQIVEALPQAVQRARDMVVSKLGPRAEVIHKATSGLGKAPGTPSGGAGNLEHADRVTGTSGPITSSLVERGVAAVFALAGHLVVIFFLIYFLLISGHHVRNRLVEIAGPDAGRRRTTSTIIDDINAQIQRYLLVLLVTAVIVSLATWAALAWMNVQHAAMWGILAGVFNSIPYFGPVIASGGLFAVGMTQGGMAQALQMSGAAIVITSLEGWLITPPLMGKAERMSALAVFLGLIIKSVADHVEGLKPVGRLMAP